MNKKELRSQLENLTEGTDLQYPPDTKFTTWYELVDVDPEWAQGLLDLLLDRKAKTEEYLRLLIKLNKIAEELLGDDPYKPGNETLRKIAEILRDKS